jgi:hypothetical protein
MIVMPQVAPAQFTDPAVENELDQLAVMPIAQLRIRYGQLFRTDPPKAFGPDLGEDLWRPPPFRTAHT